MRTDSVYRLGFHAVVINLTLLVAVNAEALGQSSGRLLEDHRFVTATGATVVSGVAPQQEASPLSQFSPNAKLIEQLNQVPVASDDEFLVTREVDLKQALRGYAAIKKCSQNEAFRETATYLKMVPRRDFAPQEMVVAQALYSIVKQDIYQITAAKMFFKRLPENLSCIENGKRHLAVEIRFLSVSAENDESFESYMLPDSYVSFNNKIPQATPYATAATYKHESGESTGQATKPKGTFVVASETRTKAYPTFMGRLNDNGVKKLLSFIKSDPASSITMAPTVSIIPGQTASISDTLMRPFIIGLNRVEGDLANAHSHQPVIQTIEDGAILKLRATGEDGKIRVDGDLALAEIESVQTFDYPEEKNSDPDNLRATSVQIPEQKLKQVHLSTLVEEGNTIFIDPVFLRTSEARTEKRGFLNSKTEVIATKFRVLLMITPRFIDVNEQNFARQ